MYVESKNSWWQRSGISTNLCIEVALVVAAARAIVVVAVLYE